MSIVAMKRALEALWNCTVKLESQQFRNPVQIPPVYSDIIKAGYSAHAALCAAIEAAERQEPTLLLNGMTSLQYVSNELHKFQEATGCDTADELPTPQPAIPDGWQLVPVEPTPEMQRAMQRAEWPDEAYKAMLAAAPEVPK